MSEPTNLEPLPYNGPKIKVAEELLQKMEEGFQAKQRQARKLRGEMLEGAKFDADHYKELLRKKAEAAGFLGVREAEAKPLCRDSARRAASRHIPPNAMRVKDAPATAV